MEEDGIIYEGPSRTSITIFNHDDDDHDDHFFQLEGGKSDFPRTFWKSSETFEKEKSLSIQFPQFIIFQEEGGRSVSIGGRV